MTHSHRSYLPAAGRDWLLPLYDLTTRLMGADRVRAALLRQAGLRVGQRVLDLGCGTGTLAVELKQQHPGLEVIGVDPDPKALALARRKAQRSGFGIDFRQGFADALEFPAASFDHVFSTFMFHHLESGVKLQALREVRRVLKPGGVFHLLDFGGPDSATGSLWSRWLHSQHRLAENAAGHVLALLAEAGLPDANIAGREPVLFGIARAVYFRACAPAESAQVHP